MSKSPVGSWFLGMNVVSEPLLPGGTSLREVVSGAELASAPVSLADPLLDPAMAELLAALLWLLARPDSERAWMDIWRAGRLHVDRAAIDVLTPCFELFAGPHAFQDATVIDLP